MKKILFIVAHRPDRSPGQRFRFEQYLPFLKNNNFDYQISYIINEKDDAVFYSKGKYFKKFFIFLKSIIQRFKDIKKAKTSDVVFIYREALMLGSTYFEKRFCKSGAKLIMDFDDAIWLRDVSRGNNNLAWLKNPSKTERIIKLCDLIITGNDYLKDYALRFHKNVITIPTTIDTDYYLKERVLKTSEDVCIGWTGSLTTLKHLELALPFLQKIKEKYGERISFRIISDFPFTSDVIAFDFVKWGREAEVRDLSYFDIGIMPLPDDEWAKGKCGFKGLQYMALEIPAIMSPVGVNTEIIQDGVNGFLAVSINEWVEKLSMLIESPELREKLGKAGRQTVLEKYSFESQKQKYLNCFQELVIK